MEHKLLIPIRFYWIWFSSLKKRAFPLLLHFGDGECRLSTDSLTHNPQINKLKICFNQKTCPTVNVQDAVLLQTQIFGVSAADFGKYSQFLGDDKASDFFIIDFILSFLFHCIDSAF